MFLRSPLIRSPLIRSPLIRSSLIRLPLFFTYPLRFALPNVAIEIATLRGYRMTFSHSSKDPLRPLSQGEKVGAFLCNVMNPLLRPTAQQLSP